MEQFFRDNPEAAVAFSGGADSAYLLHCAKRWGRRVKAYYVKTPFQPGFELADARRLAKELGADLAVLEVDVLSAPDVAANPADRCYHCKRRLFEAIRQAAGADGFALLLDGTNASDDEGQRPGVRALRELNVRSPLRECGLTKAQIRAASRQAGLFTWDKPAYACLATRIPTGEAITPEKLRRTEAAEAALTALGFRDFRVRGGGDTARLELTEEDLGRLMANRAAVLAALRPHYKKILLDLEVRP